MEKFACAAVLVLVTLLACWVEWCNTKARQRLRRHLEAKQLHGAGGLHGVKLTKILKPRFDTSGDFGVIAIDRVPSEADADYDALAAIRDKAADAERLHVARIAAVRNGPAYGRDGAEL